MSEAFGTKLLAGKNAIVTGGGSGIKAELDVAGGAVSGRAGKPQRVCRRSLASGNLTLPQRRRDTEKSKNPIAFLF